LNNTATPPYFPPYGQFTIEAIESKLTGILIPNDGDSFIVNGAPFNGAGAGFDPVTGNIDAMLAHQTTAINNIAIPSNPASLANTYGPNILAIGAPGSDTTLASYRTPNEYVALLPNYASYESGSAPNNAGNSIVFDWQSPYANSPGVANKV